MESVEIASIETNTSPKKKKRKSFGDDAEEGDVEIWIPNKKYKGSLKGQMEKQLEKQNKEVRSDPYEAVL